MITCDYCWQVFDSFAGHACSGVTYVQPDSVTAPAIPQKPVVCLSWECHRCGAVNAPWVSQCSCRKH